MRFPSPSYLGVSLAVLRVIVDQMVAPVPGGIGRYTEELTRELITNAPTGCSVEGIVSASPEADYARILDRLPGLGNLHKLALSRRELSAAWQLGFTHLPGRGMVHSTSMLAPLHKHDILHDANDQTIVTVHDAVPWTHPETLTSRGVSWHKAMAKRAQKYADAIVVPTHAVADALTEFVDFGDRIRVIGGASSSRLALPKDAAARAEKLGLPERYVLAVGTIEPRKGIDALITAMSRPELGDVPLVHVGPAGWGDLDIATLAKEAGLAEERLIDLGTLDDTDLAVVYERATVFALPSLSEGFGLPLLEAFKLGTPVVHSDAPALVEVAGDAGLAVELDSADEYPERLAAALANVLDDSETADRLSALGLDRVNAYSWRSSAEKVWELHASL
jgi:glycosyltransferase involved in cell wall biosynthesis